MREDEIIISQNKFYEIYEICDRDYKIMSPMPNGII